MSKFSTQRMDDESFEIMRDSFYIQKSLANNGEFQEIDFNEKLAIDDMGFNVSGCKSIWVFLRSLVGKAKLPKILDGGLNRKGLYVLSPFGEKLYSLSVQTMSLRVIREFYRLHPKLEVFYSFVDSNKLIALIDEAKMTGDTKRLDELLSDFHKLLKSSKQLNDERNFFKGPEKNTKLLNSYVSSLFKLNAKLLVVRVDLSYLSKFSKAVTPEEIMKHRKALVSKNKNNPLTKNWLGYAWRLEYARNTGLHLHFVVFIDGSKYKSDVMAASKIGQRWIEITGGRGRFYNCNLNVGKYRYVGIGLVDHSDTEKRGHMMKALSYLTKAEKLAKLKIDKAKTFGRGKVIKRVNTLGRPRRKSNADTPISLIR